MIVFWILFFILFFALGMEGTNPTTKINGWTGMLIFAAVFLLFSKPAAKLEKQGYGGISWGIVLFSLIFIGPFIWVVLTTAPAGR